MKILSFLKNSFLKTSEGTNGDYFLIEVMLTPGGGNTLHYHKTFEAMEGALVVQVRKEHKLLQPGNPILSTPAYFIASITHLIALLNFV